MMEKRHLLLAAIMSVIFGTGWVLAKVALGHFPPVLLAALRFGSVGLFFLWFVKPPSGRWAEMALISLLAVSVPYAMSYTGMRDLDVSTTVLLVQLEAPCLVLLGCIMLREYPGYRKILGIVIAFAGIIPIAGTPDIRENWPAALWVLASILVWGTGQIRIRRMKAGNGFSDVVWISALAAPQLLILSLLLERGQTAAILQADAGLWATVLYQGVLMTAVGIGSWYHLIARYPMAQVSPFLLLVPVTAILGGVILLGENPHPAELSGGLIILAGVTLVIVERPFNIGPLNRWWAWRRRNKELQGQ